MISPKKSPKRNLHLIWYVFIFRFGIIVALKSAELIKKGEEIFANYNYKLNMEPDWYTDLRLQFEREEEGRKQKSIDQTS